MDPIAIASAALKDVVLIPDTWSAGRLNPARLEPIASWCHRREGIQRGVLCNRDIVLRCIWAAFVGHHTSRTLDERAVR